MTINLSDLNVRTADSWRYVDLTRDTPPAQNSTAYASLQTLRSLVSARVKADRCLSFAPSRRPKNYPSNGAIHSGDINALNISDNNATNLVVGHSNGSAVKSRSEQHKGLLLNPSSQNLIENTTFNQNYSSTALSKEEANPFTGEYSNDFSSRVVAAFVELIERDLTKFNRVSGGSESAKSITRDVLSFACGSTACFPTTPHAIPKLRPTGYTHIEDAIRKLFATGARESHGATIIRGCEGSGKSAMLDFVVETAVNIFEQANVLLVPRWVGHGNKTKTGWLLLQDICAQLAMILGVEESVVRLDAMEAGKLSKTFGDLLTKFSKSG